MNKKVALTTLLLGCIFTIASPVIFSSSSNYCSFDFTKTGEIGDTIGGITSPIIGLLGAILLYFALTAQIEANKIIQDQITEQKKDEVEKKSVLYTMEKINLLRRDINEFSYNYIETLKKEDGTETKNRIFLKGSYAISQIISTLSNGTKCDVNVFEAHPRVNELSQLLDMLLSVFEAIENSSIDDEEKKFQKTMLVYLYKSKVQPTFITNQYNRATSNPYCENCGRQHMGIPEEIFEVIDKIDQLIS